MFNCKTYLSQHLASLSYENDGCLFELSLYKRDCEFCKFITMSISYLITSNIFPMKNKSISYLITCLFPI